MTRNTPLFWTAVSAIACTVAVLLAPPAKAGDTQRFVLDSAEALGAGETEGTMVESTGQVVVGGALDRTSLGESLAYAVARAPDGSLFVGTGAEGKIFRVRGSEVELFAETGELLVTSLAVGGQTLFAGTLPQGKVLAYPLTGGEATEFAAPEGVAHIWALAWNPQRERLFAATGPEGHLLAYDPQGTASVYFDSDQEHLMSLALGDNGELYAGSNGDALVYRVRGPGQAEVLFDFPGTEITALAFRDGNLAVAANEMPAPRPATKAQRNSAPRPGKGRVWRIDGEGRSERLLKHDRAHFTALAIDSEGHILAGGGRDGRLFRIAGDGTHAIFADVEERQVLSIDTESGLSFVTGDAAAVYQLQSRPAQEPTYLSKALDARFVSRFGRLTWRGEGEIEVSTRSGNRETPDETWSAWSQGLQRPGPVRSPAARFVQVRVRLRSDDAVLRALELYYLPQNQAARVTNVGLKAPTKNDAIPEASSEYKLHWTTANPDGDPLRYRLRYRREEQQRWRPMFPESEVLTKNQYTWNTSGLADGHYVVEVEASDETENAATRAERRSRQSEPLLIDNHPPTIQGARIVRGRLEATVTDALGPIRRLEIAIDGGPFQRILPDDQLLDAAEERVRWSLPTLTDDNHIVALRATDAAGNTAIAEVSIP